MHVEKVEVGRERGPKDGSKRYTPVVYSFDTRALMLSQEIGEDWEPDVQEQWRINQANVREHLIHEFGVEDYEQKIQNFVDMDAAPWSVAGLHTTYLQQVRAAFVSTHYYPALLGTCGLGERLLNQLVLTLRNDYADHPATKHVKNKKSFDDWPSASRPCRRGK